MEQGVTATSAKSEDHYFRDWESHVFGFGYGSGEPHTLPALKALLAAIPERPYDYEVLERELTPAVAWLLINALCRCNIFDYGSSPRYGWLTPEGERLKAYVDARTAEELLGVTWLDGDDIPHCYPDTCNCGPHGYDPKAKCANPFWR